MKLTKADVKNIIYSISSHIAYLLEKKILKFASSAFDLNQYDLDKLIEEKGYEDTIVYLINDIFLSELEKKFESEISIKRKREILEEYEFLSEEIIALVDLYYKRKEEEEKMLKEQTTLSVERFLNAG